jgi:hypothetical protein
VFHEQNLRKLELIQEEHSKLFLFTEAVQLGVLSLKSVVSELAAGLELNITQMTIAPIPKGGETVSLNLSLAGTFESVVNFLSAIRAYPYLQDKQVTIKIDSKSAECSCDLSLSLRCRVQPQPKELKRHEPKVHSTL